VARRTDGSWSKYRSATKRLAELEPLCDKVQRSRPRARGKKAAKTRASNKLKRQIAATKGLLTKARNRIARGAAQCKAAKSAATRKRSAAAKKGWTKRKRSAPAISHTAVPRAETSRTNHRMRFLEERDGSARQIYVVLPDRADRAAVQTYWHAIDILRTNGSTNLLRAFEGLTVFDASREQRLPFVTDPTLLLEAVAAGQTDFDDLYVESKWTSAA